MSALHHVIDQVRGGVGGMLWVEGDPGIGKSSLLAVGLDIARERGCEVLWATADLLGRSLPLRLMMDCLQVRSNSPDPRRARIADLVLLRRPGLMAGVDTAQAAAAELLMELVEESCAAKNTVLVLDDLHWADDVSLMLMHRLMSIAAELPLSLVFASRPDPRRPLLRQLRTAMRDNRGAELRLGPLQAPEVADLVAGMVGAPPGRGLTKVTAQALGNPLFLCELVDALRREGLIRVAAGTADVPDAAVGITLGNALSSRLTDVPAGTADLVRLAALLGTEFTVTDLAVLVGLPAIDLTADVERAMDAGILVPADRRMAFRHPLIHQAIYHGLPLAIRTALHRDAARALAANGATSVQVAQQLLTADLPNDPWSRNWLFREANALTVEAPGLAAELLRKQLRHGVDADGARPALLVALAWVLMRLGEHEEAEECARQALAIAPDPEDQGRMFWVLARSRFSGGQNDAAAAALSQALLGHDLPPVWRGRLLASLAMFQRAGVGAIGLAEATAREALAVGEAAADAFTIAYALTSLSIIHSVRRKHADALACADRAIEVLGLSDEHADLRALLMHGRIFSLQSLSRWSAAETTLRELGGERAGHVAPGVTAAVLMYWTGRWDDALAELGEGDRSLAAATYHGLRERGPALLLHGVAALIAAHQHNARDTATHIQAGLKYPVSTIADRENRDFLVAAQSLRAEQDGDLERATSLLTALLDRRPGEMTLSHQWLPDLVRLSLAVDDHAALAAALTACRSEAEAEAPRARAGAAYDRCRGLAEVDPVPLREAESHYRTSGALIELAGTLEDLAVVLARCGDTTGARRAASEAIDLFASFGAHWDIRRAESRLRGAGIRRGVRGRRPVRPQRGWGR